ALSASARRSMLRRRAYCIAGFALSRSRNRKRSDGSTLWSTLWRPEETIVIAPPTPEDRRVEELRRADLSPRRWPRRAEGGRQAPAGARAASSCTSTEPDSCRRRSPDSAGTARRAAGARRRDG